MFFSPTVELAPQRNCITDFLIDDSIIERPADGDRDCLIVISGPGESDFDGFGTNLTNRWRLNP
jgi:hypothetical protein